MKRWIIITAIYISLALGLFYSINAMDSLQGKSMSTVTPADLSNIFISSANCPGESCSALNQLCFQNDGTIYRVTNVSPCTWLELVAENYTPVRSDCTAYLTGKTSTTIRVYTCMNSTNDTFYYVDSGGVIHASGCTTTYLKVKVNSDTGNNTNTEVNFLDSSSAAAIRGGTATAPTVAFTARNINPDRQYFPNCVSDLMNASFSSPVTPCWVRVSVNTGTNSVVTGTVTHPGQYKETSSTTANSGAFIGTSINSVLLGGTETTELIFQVLTTANTTVRFGFGDTQSITAPVDGAWINIAGTTLDGRTSSNSVSSTTGTNYTIAATTWYRAKVAVNSTATQVDFYLYNEAGTQLWTASLTTNIPTAAGREVGNFYIATNSGISAVDLLLVDYISFVITRALVR